MKITEDEVIGELRYLTVEFDQAELVSAGCVISQGAVRRYFDLKHSPDLKVKKCGGLKLDSQRDIVTMRFGVVKDKVSAAKELFLPPKTEPKLLNPGYDELLTEVRTLRLKAVGREKMSKKCDELQREKDIVGRLYDTLATVASKDAQKFSDLLVENEKTGLALLDAVKEVDKLKKQLTQYQLDVLACPDDSAGLTNAKKVLEDSYKVPLSKIDLGEEDSADLAKAEEVLAKNDSVEMTGVDGSKIEGEKAEDGVRGDRSNEITVADSDEENK